MMRLSADSVNFYKKSRFVNVIQIKDVKGGYAQNAVNFRINIDLTRARV